MALNVKGYKNYGDLIFPDDPLARSGEVKFYYLTPEELEEFNRLCPPKPSKRDAGLEIIANMDREVYKKHNKTIKVWW